VLQVDVAAHVTTWRSSQPVLAGTSATPLLSISTANPLFVQVSRPEGELLRSALLVLAQPFSAGLATLHARLFLAGLAALQARLFLAGLVTYSTQIGSCLADRFLFFNFSACYIPASSECNDTCNSLPRQNIHFPCQRGLMFNPHAGVDAYHF
jgi:hypothetical protein